MGKWLNIFSPKAVVLELLLISICIVDDSSVIPNVILENHLARAVVDTLTHGVIAALSWLLVTDFQMNMKNLTEVMSCGVFGMVIDVDHFIAAGSLSLSAATSLSKRPFFHNSFLSSPSSTCCCVVYNNGSQACQPQWLGCSSWPGHHTMSEMASDMDCGLHHLAAHRLCQSGCASVSYLSVHSCSGLSCYLDAQTM
ncbi:hypothetical protein LSAT2_032814 [Lamellibrachia satsuma]|nr:hypothetical protein LSAT2_032814 [Lamellibrachia satsuma]